MWLTVTLSEIPTEIPTEKKKSGIWDFVYNPGIWGANRPGSLVRGWHVGFNALFWLILYVFQSFHNKKGFRFCCLF